MLKDLPVANTYIVCGHTDMRKSIYRITAIVRQNFQLDVYSGSLFFF